MPHDICYAMHMSCLQAGDGVRLHRSPLRLTVLCAQVGQHDGPLPGAVSITF